MTNKTENPFKGDTAWGDFKNTSLGSIMMGIVNLLIALAWISLVGILLYGILKATYCWFRKLFTGKPLPDFEEFPKSWYAIALMFWFFVAFLFYSSQMGGCYNVLGVHHIDGYRTSDTEQPYYSE